MALSPALAQEDESNRLYEKFLSQRTPISSLDRTTPGQTVLGFAQASLRSDHFTAYFYLSADAKRGFVNALLTGDAGRLFDGYDPADPPTAIALGAVGEQDLLLDLQMDGARIFDDVMFAAEEKRLLPFGFGPGIEIASETVEDGLGTVELVSGAEPSLLIFHLSQLSNGEWRIDLIGPERRREDALPWAVRQ